MTLTLPPKIISSGQPRVTLIKICGVSTPEAIEVAAQEGANGIGFVRAKNSPRYVDLETSKALLAQTPSTLTSVAVYVDAPSEEIAKLPVDAIQLHGQESESVIASLSAQLPETIVIRGFPFSRSHLNRWQEHPGIHAVLVDGASAGGGASFNYQPLVDIRHTLTSPLILAGGLTPDNVGDVITLLRPWAVDISSGVESAPGVKDHGAIRAFCQAVQAADRIRSHD
jgi:phosphoribosylanthranilate isomerase